MAEWSIAAVLKTVDCQRSGGSNPSLSALKAESQDSAFLLYIYNMKILAMWKEENNKLVRTFKFVDFSEAFAFMTRVAMLAETHTHHPNWSNVWNTVNIELTTHEVGNIITQKDRKLAKAIDKLLD
jgi:4a-hydroxytetrahydrobiopterin dehydratase